MFHFQATLVGKAFTDSYAVIELLTDFALCLTKHRPSRTSSIFKTVVRYIKNVCEWKISPLAISSIDIRFVVLIFQVPIVEDRGYLSDRIARILLSFNYHDAVVRRLNEASPALCMGRSTRHKAGADLAA